MTRRNKDLGDWGEKQASDFLQRRGFLVVEHNYHTTTGEIDIVAQKGGDYYFVEVKTRLAQELATDLAVTPGKLRRFKKAIAHYCYRRNLPETGIIPAAVIVELSRARQSAKLRFVVLNGNT